MNQENIGMFIAARRKELGMTQKTLAEKIEVSDKAISKWERGNGLPDITRLDELCAALQINVNELLSGEKLSESSYSEKAEENIMSLIEENERNKRNGLVQYVIGGVLVVLGLLLLGVSIKDSSVYSVVWYLDLPSALLMALFICVCILLAKDKTKLSVISMIKNVSIPVGLFISLFSAIYVLANISEMGKLLPSLSVCLLPVLYGLVIYIVTTVMKSHLE